MIYVLDFAIGGLFVNFEFEVFGVWYNIRILGFCLLSVWVCRGALCCRVVFRGG